MGDYTKVGEGEGTAANSATTSLESAAEAPGGAARPGRVLLSGGSCEGGELAVVAAAGTCPPWRRRASFSAQDRHSLPPSFPACPERSRMASSHRTLDLSDSHPGGEQIRSPHESPITSHESRALDPSTQPGTPRWTHPLVSRWKQSSRVEPARNSIPAPWTLVRIDPAPESLSPLLPVPPFPLCFPACPGRGRAASSHRGAQRLGLRSHPAARPKPPRITNHESLITASLPRLLSSPDAPKMAPSIHDRPFSKIEFFRSPAHLAGLCRLSTRSRPQEKQ